jgi:hypothetical protein
MPPPKAWSPRHSSRSDRAPNKVGIGKHDKQSDSKRSARRQHLARHLHACGERPILEALLAVSVGRPLDDVLEDFARLPPEFYKAQGADRLPMDVLVIIDGRAL